MQEISIVLKEGAKAPSYQSKGSAGADCYAYLPEKEIIIEPHKSALIPTVIMMAIPEGYEVQVRPRSGLALKSCVTVLNTPGTIDSDYRGEVGVILINHSDNPFVVKHHDRIAQFVFSKTYTADYNIVSSLDETERGANGFGSTGV